MKTNIERVYSKMPQKKHNFRKHNIELGLVQDLEDRVYDMVPVYEELVETSDERGQVGIEYSKLKDKEAKLVATLKEEKSIILFELNEAKAKAKELGIELDVGVVIEKQLEDLESAIRVNIAF
jgi:hypothetical protein